MAQTLTQLLAPPTAAQVLQWIITSLQSNGLPVTDWAIGSVARTLAQAVADGLLDYSANMIPTVAGAGFIDYAPGLQSPNYPATPDWLGQITAPELYNLNRNPAQSTIGTVTLSAAVGSGPYTITPGQLWITGPSGNQYNNTTGGTVPAGGSLTGVLVQSSGVGSAYSDAANTLTQLLTPLPGLSVNNPAPNFSPVTQAGTGTGTLSLAPTTGTAPNSNTNVQIIITTSGAPGTATFSYSVNSAAAVSGGTITASGMTYAVPGTNTTVTFNGAAAGSWVLNDVYTWSSLGSWMTQQGTDAETDASLIARCKARWPSLGGSATSDVYTLWAKSASSSVTRVRAIADPNVAGMVDVYLAGPAGAVSGATISQVTSYIQLRIGIAERVSVLAASAVWFQLAGTATVKAQYSALAQTAAAANVAAVIAGTPIGPATVYASELVEAVMSAPGPAPGMTGSVYPVQAVVDFSAVNVQTSTTGPSGPWTTNGNANVALTTGQVAVFAQNAITWSSV